MMMVWSKLINNKNCRLRQTIKLSSRYSIDSINNSCHQNSPISSNLTVISLLKP
ncbi:hypothetical protein O53_1801 [Microcystis aeruginosa TAIHU98]|uniref:Uncharacterized protein n=1 Tax=Microcystis aeruginosa TAIHU98 TaxID=1134457 RepID=L7EDW9_MICAE|nr:hypothetical protein O53_1801 [Microcystis aeruginosa TAIHU98]ODV36946.1 hypothetical protein BFG60_3601 [Microcystis aeruginosa NIES-98]